jgi:hypothetical protein
MSMSLVAQTNPWAATAYPPDEEHDAKVVYIARPA